MVVDGARKSGPPLFSVQETRIAQEVEGVTECLGGDFYHGKCPASRSTALGHTLQNNPIDIRDTLPGTRRAMLTCGMSWVKEEHRLCCNR